MAVLSTKTKGRLADRKAKGVNRVGGPHAFVPVAKVAIKTSGPIARRRARRRAAHVSAAARSFASTMAQVPEAAQRLGLIEAPKAPRTKPWFTFGVVMGASAVYFLEPGQGREHRQQVLRLVR